MLKFSCCLSLVLALACLVGTPAEAAGPLVFRGRTPGLVASGRYDAATQLALKRYQLAVGLPPTGLADPETIWRLGLVTPGTYRRGDRGASVLAIQRALRYYEAGGAIRRLPRLPRATPGGVLAVKRTIVTSAPRPQTLTPVTPLPTPEPLPVAVLLTPMPLEPVAAPMGPFSGSIGAGAWLAPAASGLPLLTVDGTFFIGDWGLAAGFAQAPDLGLPPAGDVLDAQLRWQGLKPVWLGLGGRMLNGEPFGTLGLGLETGLGLDWLRGRAEGLGGYSPSGAWTADGRATLGLVWGPVEIEAGYRVLAADALAGMVTLGLAHGPVVSAGIRF